MRIVLAPGRLFFPAAAAAAATHVVCIARLLLPLAVLQLLPGHLTTTTAVQPAATFTPPFSSLATAIQQRVSAAAAAAAVPMTTESGLLNGRRTLLFGNNNKMEFSPIRQATRARALQTTGAGDEVCELIEAFEDDDDTLQKFESTFRPTCTCRDENPFDYTGFLEQNPIPENASVQDLQDWLDDFNAYGSNLESDKQVGCINSCSVCVSTESPCLILEEQKRTKLRGAWNFTLEEFATYVNLVNTAGTDTAVDYFVGQTTGYSSTTTSTECYTVEGSSSGKVCLATTLEFSSEEGVTLTELADEPAMVGCSISVDGVDCTSCSFDATAVCVMADCTNIAGGSSASISIGCGGEDRASYPGMFGPIYDLAPDNVAYTLGSCDGSSPTPPAVTTPVATPVASSPVLAPTAASSPVASSPVASSPVASSPSAGASSPVASPPSAGASDPPPRPPIFGNSSGIITAYGVGQPMLVLASAFAALVMVL